MKQFFLWLLISASAFGQGSVRRFDSVAEMLAMNPVAVAVNGVLTAEIQGYYSQGDTGDSRIANWIANSTLATNYGNVFASPFGGQWVFADRSNSTVNIANWGAKGDGTNNDTAAILNAASYVSAGKRLFAPGGKTYVLDNVIQLTNSNTEVDFSGSTIKFTYSSRLPAIRIGPAIISITNLTSFLYPTTNIVTGLPAGEFSAGDMVFLFNDVEDPVDYIPGQFAFITAVSGTSIYLDRFPLSTSTVTRAYRYPIAPKGSLVKNVAIDLAACGDCIGVSALGSDHVIEQTRITGTGTATDPNYIGIEIIGQNIEARNNRITGILDYNNQIDRAGYGIFLAGDSCTARNNSIADCKHNLSTSMRTMKSYRLRFIDNILRQRGDWANLTDSFGNPTFLGNLDVHANVISAEIRGNFLESWGQYNFVLRNGNFELVNNYSIIHQQTNLSLAQHHIGFAEAFIKRAYIAGNQFNTPDATLVMYFAQRASGSTGTHSNMTWIGNSFENGIFSLQDASGGTNNKFVDTQIIGNHFNRPTGTPVFFPGPMSNTIFSANIVRYANGNGITVAVPGNDANNPQRQLFIANNSFISEDAAGYDIRIQSGPTNIIHLGQNRYSANPTLGFPASVPVSLYGVSETFPRIAASKTKLNFGSGAENPNFGLSALYAGALELDGIFTVKTTNSIAAAFGTYQNTFSNRFDFFIRSDGFQGYNYAVWDTNVFPILSTNTTIAVGPRRTADLSNGVYRLSGAFGITERNEPITPEGNTASLWLQSSASKQIYVKWSDGTTSVLWNSLNDGSGSSLDADLLDGQHGSYYLDRANHTGTQSYTTISGLGGMATVSDAASNNTYYARRNSAWSALASMANVADATADGNYYARQNNSWAVVPTATTPTYSTGLTNSGATVYGNYFPGANMTAITNGTMVTLNATINTNALTNSWQIAIDSTIVLTPNIVDSSEINPSAAGTNLSFALFNNSIATNKIDSTFYNWVLSQAGGTPSVRVDGTSVTNIKTSSDIAFTTGSSEATPALTTTAVTPGSYSNATITVDSKGRITAASVTPQPAVVFPVSSLVAIDGTVLTNLNFADNSIVTFAAAGTNVTADIQNNSITTNKIDSTFMAALSQFLGKATWKANPNTVGTEVSSLTVKGIVSTVLFSQYTASGGCVSYDEYDVQFSSDIGTSYTPVILIEGSKSGIQPTGGIVQNNDGSSSISGTGFKVWRAHGVDEPCLDDGYRITVLINNY